MADAWRRFGAAYRMELRLLCISWTYPLLQLIWAAFVYFAMRNQIFGSAQAALKGNLGLMTMGLVSLAALFTGAAGAARGPQTRFAALADSFPTGQEVIVGRWFAVVTALMGATAAPLVFAWHLGPADSFLAGAPSFLRDALLTFAFTSAGAWWIIDRLGIRRWVYPLVGAGWLGFLFTFELVLKGDLSWPAVLLLDFMRTTRPLYDEAWANALEGGLPVWFGLFYLGLTVLLVAGTLWQSHRRRMRRHPVVPALGALLALGIAVTGALGYTGEIQDREAMQQADLTALEAGADPSHRKTLEAITAYDVTADLTAPTHPRFTAAITVTNQSDTPLETIYLTLHRQFTVTEVSLPYERAGHYLELRPPQPLAPGAQTRVSLSYEGPLTAIQERFDGFPEIIFFTTDDGVRLSQNAGWYPLAGWQRLITNMEHLEAVPAAFRLTVTAPPGWGVFTALPSAGDGRFEAADATWAALLASPRLTVAEDDGVTLVAARNEIDLLGQLAPNYRRTADHMARFFPGLELKGLTVVMLDEAEGFPFGTPPAGATALSILSRASVISALNRPENAYFHVSEPLLRDVWMMSGGSIQMNYLHEIGRFLYSYHLANGDAARMADQQDRPVGRILYAAYVEHGEAGVARALAAVLRDPSSLETHQMDAFESLVKGAAASAP